MFTNIPSAVLKQMVKLSERKETLMSQIQEIDRQMIRVQRSIEGQSPAPLHQAGSGSIRKARTGRRRTRRGALKESIVQTLRTAGARGITIRELSDKLRVKPANLYVWFNGTGRKTRGIKKMGPAKYRLVG